LGSIGGGWLSGHFMKLGWSLNRARKVTFLVCGLCVLPVVFATVTHDPWVAVGLITLAAAAHQAWSANAYSLASDMFPRRVVGSVTGFGGFAGSVGAIGMFVGVAHLREAAIQRGQPGNYFAIFLAASLAYLAALLVVHLLAPRLEPAQVEEPTGSA
jgi:ACS family hexuronate transporter-like MFS transporter